MKKKIIKGHIKNIQSMLKGARYNGQDIILSGDNATYILQLSIYILNKQTKDVKNA